MKKTCKLTVMLFVLTAVLFSMILPAFATTVTLCDGNVTISDSENTGKFENGEYTATVKGSLFSKKTNTITVTNFGEKSASIKFVYSVSKASSFVIAGATAETSGEYSCNLDSGKNLKIELSAGYTMATLKITNITYTTFSEADITLEFDSALGSVTADGVNVNAGGTVTVGEAGTNLVATPTKGAKFIAWVDSYGKIIEKASAYTHYFDMPSVVRALFTVDTPYFMVDDEYVFDNLGDAVALEGGKKIVLVCDGTLPAGDYTIPSGKTLLVPYDDANTLYNNSGPEGIQGYTKPSVYRKLTMASGANIIVEGSLNVSANQSSSTGSTGLPTGKYGQIAMGADSTITVKNGATLYAWGYITGSGSITAESGAMVYENFQVEDWRGGDVTSQMVSKNSNRVFPMSQYYVQNIEVPLTLMAGAVENGFMTVYVTLINIQKTPVPFIGPSGMFNITSGSITKDYIEDKDRLHITVNGTLEMKSLSISMKLGILGTTTMNSEEFVLPVNGNITLDVKKGSKAAISNDISLLPGAVINIEKGAECSFANDAEVFIYDSENWGNYCSLDNKKFVPLAYAPGRTYTRTEADLKDAEVYIMGSIDASGGYVFTTTGGANIHGDEGATVKMRIKESPTSIYQVRQNNTDIDGYDEIKTVNALLINSDGTYTAPKAMDECYVYACYDGKWLIKAEHTFKDSACTACGCEEMVTAAAYTLTEDGKNLLVRPTVSENVPEDAKVMVATYDANGQQLGFFEKNASELTTVTFPAQGVSTFKVFAWDAFTSMKPFSAEEETVLK